MRSGVGKSVEHHDPVPCLLSAGVIAIIRFPFQCDTTKSGDDCCRVSGKQEALFVAPPTGRSGKVGVGSHNSTGYCGFEGAGDFRGC